MSTKTLHYLHLPPDTELPALPTSPFIGIVLVEAEVSDTWMWDASRWLAASGCRFLLAWGRDAQAWSEAVDEAVQEACDYEDVAPERQVPSAAFEDEEIEEAFWFARHRAAHPALTLDRTLILHIAPAARRDPIEALYAAA